MQTAELKDVDSVVVRFAGDSGDGMQLTGTQFTDTAAFLGKDLATFPEFPAEIRAPAGTLAGLSGFQVHFGSKEIFTPGDTYDVLIAMNAAALKVDLANLKKGGIVIANIAGFDAKNIKLAEYPDGSKPLEDGTLDNYTVYKMDVTKMTKLALEGSGLGNKDIERSKNMFVLGLLYWMFDKSMDYTITFINEKFGKKPDIAAANIKTMKAGYNYGDTAEIFTTRFRIGQADMPKGTYRNIMGNQATAIGFVCASQKSGLPLYLGSYPITPASDILHELSKYKNMGVKTFQAEDEIAAITSSIGAAFGGSLAITTTSGPGVALKGEALGLAMILEIPLVLVDVQRGGPSTGLPTKTEQSDLMIAMFGRHGESPLPILAAATPSDCFNMAFEASRIAIEHMTPVVLLTDGYIANGSEPWKFPKESDLGEIKVSFLQEPNGPNGKLLPYKRDEKLVRPWIRPGTKGLMHRIGGLEKQDETGNVNYEAKNHEFMTKVRQAKVDKLADYIPLQTIETGKEDADLCILGWGSTFGAIKAAVIDVNAAGNNVAHVHLRYMNPFPKNLGEVLSKFKRILIPEMNNRQLARLIRDKFLFPAESFNKIQGLPFSTEEMKAKILETLNKK